MGLRISVIAAALISQSPPPSGAMTISNVVTTSGPIAVTAGVDTGFSVVAATTDAAGLVFSSTGVPLGAIAGPAGSLFNVSIPADVTSVHVDWAGSGSGSLTFNLV